MLVNAKAGLKQLEFLRDKNARYFEQNPAAGRYLDKMLNRNIAYVAHEFCNEHFHPMYFSDVADEMARIGLSYAGSAKVVNNHPDMIVSSRFFEHLEESADRTAYETRLSLIRNEFFRRDIYFKGQDVVAEQDRHRLLMDCIPGSVVAEADVRRESDAGRHVIRYRGKLYDDLIRIAAAGALTVKEICGRPEFQGVSADEVLAALNKLLIGKDFKIFAARAVPAAGQSGGRFRIADAVNRAMLDERLLIDGKCYVGSRVLGSAIRLSLMRGLALQAIDAVGMSAAAGFMEEALEGSGQWWPKHLRGSSSSRERKAWIEKELSHFERRWIPRLLRLGIVEAL